MTAETDLSPDGALLAVSVQVGAIVEAARALVSVADAERLAQEAHRHWGQRAAAAPVLAWFESGLDQQAKDRAAKATARVADAFLAFRCVIEAERAGGADG